MSDKPQIPLSWLRQHWKNARMTAVNWGGEQRDIWRGWVAEEVAERTIASLQAENAALRAQLAAAQAGVWLPVEDGQHEFSTQEGVRINGSEFEARVIPIIEREDNEGNSKKVMLGMEAVIIELPPGIRLCRRQPLASDAATAPRGQEGSDG